MFVCGSAKLKGKFLRPVHKLSEMRHGVIYKTENCYCCGRYIIDRGGDTKQKVGGLTYIVTYTGCNRVHVGMPAKGILRHAPPGHFLHIRPSEVHSDAI